MSKIVGFTIKIEGQKEVTDLTKVFNVLQTQLLIVNQTMIELNKNTNGLASSFDGAKGILKDSMKSFQDTSKAAKDLGNGYIEVVDSVEATGKSISDLKKENKDLKKFLEEAPKEGQAGYQELSAELDKAREQFASNREEINKFNKELRTGTKESEIAEGSVLDLRNKVKDLTKEYNALSPAQRQATEGKEIQKNLASTVKELKTLEEAVGDNRRSVGDYKKAFEGLGGVFGPLKSGIASINGAFKLLIANPIVAVIAAIVAGITALAQAFKSTQEGTEFFNRASAALGATLDVIRDIAVNVGKGLIELFSNPVESLKALGQAIVTNIINRFTGVIALAQSVGKVLKAAVTLNLDELKQAAGEAGQSLTQVATGLDPEQQRNVANAIAGVTDEISREAAEAARLTGVLQELDNVQRDLSVSRANLNADLVEARAFARDDTKSLGDRIKALKQVQAAEKQQIDAELAAQQRRVDALKALAVASDTLNEGKDEIAQAEIKLANLRQQSSSAEISLLRELQRLEKQRASEAKKRQEEETKRLQAVKKEQDKLLEDLQNESLARLKIVADLSNQLIDAEIANNQNKVEALIKQEEERFRREKETRANNLSELEKDAAEKRAEVIRLFGEESQELKDFEAKTGKEISDIKETNRKLDEQKEKEHQANITKIQKDAADARKKALTEAFDETRNAITKGFGILSSKIKEATDSAKKNQDELKKKSQEISQAIQDITNSVFSGISSILEATSNAEVQRLEDLKLQRQENIDDLNEELQNATGLQKKFLEKRLKEEQAAQEELTKKQKEEEKKRAKTAQVLALIQAAINGAIAITRAFSDLGPIAGAVAAVGVAAAIAAQIATIASQKFAKGGVIDGPSHSKGGVPILGGRAEVEGGEAIINKRSTAMFKPLLSAINQAGGGVKFADGGILGASLVPSAVGDSSLSKEIDRLIQAQQQSTVQIAQKINSVKVAVPVLDVQQVIDTDNNLNTQATF